MSLLAWYPLINNGNNQGLSSTNLTTTGTVTYTAGKIGNAATFTGSTANRLYKTKFTETKGISICAWVKCTEATSALQFCFNNGRDSNADGWHNYFNAAGTALFLRYGNINYSYTTTLNTWYHTAMVVDDNAVYRFYINGTQVATGTVTTLPDYSEGNYFSIGCFNYTSGYLYPLKGQVQDFRYYNHVLSAKEVKELSKGLCVHYQLKGAGAGANLVPNSQIWNNSYYLKSGIARTTPAYDGITIQRFTCSTTITSGGLYTSCFSGNRWNGGKYTWSIEIRGNRSFTIPQVGHERFGSKSCTISTEWRKFTGTGTYAQSSYSAFVMYFNSTYNFTSGDWFEVRNFKVEEGSVATPWIPCVYDSSYTNLGYGRKVLPYTVVGSPTNSCGLFSNFSSANYINTGVTFAPGTNKWEVTTKVVTGTDITTVQYFQGCLNTSGSWGFLLGLSNSKIHLFLSSNGTSWDISGPLWGLAVVAATTYWFKYGYDGTQYYIKRSTDNGATYTTDVTLTSSTGIHSGAIYIGSAWDKSYPFKGNIDMEKFTITYKNNTWYSGSTSRVNAIEPDCTGYGNNGTVNGRISTTNSSPRYLSCESFTNTTITSTTGFPLSSTIPAFTINFWYKPNESVTYTAWADLVAFTINSTGTSTGATSFRLEVQDTSGGSWRWFYNNNGQSSYGFGYTTAITSSAWSMITLTVDASKNYKCYLNGTQYASGTLDSGFVPAGTTGALRVCDGGGMYGSYSDYRVYATALLADDVKELYQTSASIDKLGNTYSYEFVEE